MGNCLVTKLKAAVNNDNLSKVGEITIQIVNPNVFNFKLVPPVGENFATVRASSAVIYYADANGQRTGEAMASCPVASEQHPYGIAVAENYTGKIFCKADYKGLDAIISGGSVDLTYIEGFRSITSKNTEKGTLVTGYPEGMQFIIQSTLGNLNVTFIDEYSPNVKQLGLVGSGSGYFNINMANIVNNLPNLEIFTANRTTITNMESFADLGKCPKLVRFAHLNRYSWTLEDFVANKRSVGVTAGEGTVLYAGDNSAGGVASFNGQQMSSSAQNFSWTATTITYNGTTINA